MDKIPVPAGLAGRGARFWSTMTEEYTFRGDELELLLEVCQLLTSLAAMEAATKGAPLIVKGSTGQAKVNPLIQEIRVQRLALGSLLRQLKVPDPMSATQQPSARTKHATRAAKGRWGNGQAG